MQAELKIENGKVYAKRVCCDPWFRMPDRIRAAYGDPVNIIQWINPQSATSVWILDKIRTAMIRSSTCGDTELHGHGGRTRNIIASYDLPVMMLCPNFRDNSGYVYLLSPEGEVLAGSNVYSQGHLCLGDSFDPLTPGPVELITTAKANNDLSWFGPEIKGKITGTGTNRRFNIEEWPTEPGIFKWTPPNQIKENLDALLQP